MSDNAVEWLAAQRSAIENPQLSVQEQAEVVTALQRALDADGSEGARRSEILTLLTLLRDHPHVTHRTFEDVNATIARIPPIPVPIRPRRTRRSYAIAAVIVAALAVAGVAVAMWVPRHHSEPAHVVPLIRASQVQSLLLPPNEIDDIMQARLTPSELYNGMGESPGSERVECSSASSYVDKFDYQGHGYIGVAAQEAEAPGANEYISAKVMQAAISFATPGAAAAFINVTEKRWAACAGKAVTHDVPGGHPETWAFGRTSRAGPNVMIQASLEGGRGLRCQHVIAARSNVLFDVVACGSAPQPQADEIIDRMAARAEQAVSTQGER